MCCQFLENREIYSLIFQKIMQELNQAEDIKQLTEKVKEQNVYFSLLKKEINRAIIGQEYMVDRLLIGLLGNGHVLLEGVPGLAKTLAISKTNSSFIFGVAQSIAFPPFFKPLIKTPELVGEKAAFVTMKFS